MNLSKEVKLGCLLFNKESDKVEIITVDILQRLTNIEEQDTQDIYIRLPILEPWLEKYLDFEKVYLTPNALYIYTHIRTGFKLHKRKGRNFQIAYTFKEGPHTFKKEINYLNQLDDYILLFKGERLWMNEDLVNRINQDRIGW
ncbi:MAG: hypothetical protein ABJ092_14970 [Gillisia sp.]